MCACRPPHNDEKAARLAALTFTYKLPHKRSRAACEMLTRSELQSSSDNFYRHLMPALCRQSVYEQVLLNEIPLSDRLSRWVQLLDSLFFFPQVMQSVRNVI